jgi:hypothetical protein
MQITYTIYTSNWYQAWLNWERFWRTFWFYDQIEELSTLIAWAKRKHLSGVYQAYQRQQLHREEIIHRYFIQHPRTTILSERLHQVFRFLFPQAKINSKRYTRQYQLQYS